MSRLFSVGSLAIAALVGTFVGCSDGEKNEGDLITWDDLLLPGEKTLSSDESAILREQFPPLDYDPESSYSTHSYIILDSSLHNLERYFGDTVITSEWAQAWGMDSVEINAMLQNLIQINKTKVGWESFDFELDNDYYYIPSEYVENDWGESERKATMKELYPHHGVKLSKIAFNQDSTFAMLCLYPYPFLSNEREMDLDWKLFSRSNSGWEEARMLKIHLPR